MLPAFTSKISDKLGCWGRLGSITTIVLCLVCSSFMTSCGGGGPSAKDMVLVEFLLVDRGLSPVAPTGTESLPRNAQILMVFSELVNPNSVNNSTIQIRHGATFQSVPTGTFSVNSNTVRFDPTLTSQGQPNPFGFLPVTQYIVDIPNFEEQTGVLENLNAEPILTTFFTSFITSDGWLRELVPPVVIDVGFVPEPDGLTGNIPGNGLLYIDFSEAMDPASFIPGGAFVDEFTTVDIRYTSDAINAGASLDGDAIPGVFTHDAGATRYFFRPTFSFGTDKYIFTAQVFQGLKDLSGNLLVNPRSFGPFTCDGAGIEDGLVIEEQFMNSLDRDPRAQLFDADWGATEEGVLRGQPITQRQAYIYGYWFANHANGGQANSGNGQYAPIVDPLIGADLNNFVSNLNPPSSQGRRVMWAYQDSEMGASGAVTKIEWGPDSNATFAATYDNVILRMGFQKNNSIALGTNFTGNYEGSPATIYNGSYSVQQNANVGNAVDENGNTYPLENHTGGYPQNPGCTVINPWNAPLFNATGFYPWPDLTTFFEWDTGDPLVDNDRILLFDASVAEGDSFQQIRGWFGSTYPCSGVLINGFPNRRLTSTHEQDDANPTTNLGAGILNPEPTVMDMCFHITKRTSAAQSLFFMENLPPGTVTNSPETFGPATDYRPAEIFPVIQNGGAQVVIEFQGAELVEDDRFTPNLGGETTDWTQDINECDGFANIRWRAFLVSNLSSQEIARVITVRIPFVSTN